MAKIGGLTTVNCGTIVEFKDSCVEVLGPGYSSHHINCVVAYVSEGKVKVEVVYSNKTFTVYRFHNHNDLQHYWSRIYECQKFLAMPKYNTIGIYLIDAYRQIFGGQACMR